MVTSSIHLFSLTADPLVIITRAFRACNLPQIRGLNRVVSLQYTIFSTPYSLNICPETEFCLMVVFYDFYLNFPLITRHNLLLWRHFEIDHVTAQPRSRFRVRSCILIIYGSQIWVGSGHEKLSMIVYNSGCLAVRL